jgi:hypothetical protein
MSMESLILFHSRTLLLIIVCCHILDIGKIQDLKNNKTITESVRRYPTVEHILGEFRRILRWEVS